MTLGGVDLIKDDHSLAAQWWAPFHDRVGRCQAAIRAANEEVGGSTVYLPTLTASGAELLRRVEYLHSIGCQGATVLPVFQGWDTVRELAATSGLALLGHPSGSCVFFQDRAGIAPDVLLGQIYRLAGFPCVSRPFIDIPEKGRVYSRRRTCTIWNKRHLAGRQGPCFH